MHRIMPLNWVQWLSLATAVALAVLMPVIIIRIQDVQHHQNDAIRSIMCFAENFVKHSPHATPSQKLQAIKFYGDALSNAHLAPCDP